MASPIPTTARPSLSSETYAEIRQALPKILDMVTGLRIMNPKRKERPSGILLLRSQEAWVLEMEDVMEKGRGMHHQKIEVLFPRAEEFEEAETPKQGERFSDISGKRFLLVDDMRPNADVLLAALHDILVRDYAVDASVADVRSLGGDYAEQIPRKAHERLAGQFDAVIVAVAS